MPGSDSEEKKKQRYADAAAILKQGGTILADSLSPKLSSDPKLKELTWKMIAATDTKGLANTQIAIAKRPERLHVLERLTCPILIIAVKRSNHS